MLAALMPQDARNRESWLAIAVAGWRELMNKGDGDGLRRVVQIQLWRLMPGDPEQRRLGYDSGVR